MSELEKLVIACAAAIFLFIFSDNVGRLIYGPTHMLFQQGYKIKVADSRESTPQATALPDVLDMQAIMSAANVIAGEATFKKVCTLCHTSENGGPNKVGPNLWGVFGGAAAHKEDFNYSNAMLERKSSGTLWNEEELYRYLYSPKQYVVGTKMAFAGLKNDQDRANVIAYIKTLQ